MKDPNEEQKQDSVPLMAYTDDDYADNTKSQASTIDLENGYFT